MRLSSSGRTRRHAAAGVALSGLLLLAGCGGDGGGSEASGSASGSETERGDITVGAFNFGESEILANMYALALEDEGYTAEVRSLTNREVVEPALEQGDIDVVPEYVGTLTEFLNLKINGEGAEPVASGELQPTVEALRGLAEQRGLEVLEPSQAADENAFAVQTSFAEENDLQTLSDLAALGQPVVLGGPPECPDRPFCQPGLEEQYGLQISDFRSLDAGGPLTKQALSNGDIDLGLVFSSDGSLDQFGLTVLEDDKNLQTVDNIVPVVNAEAVEPTLVEALNRVSQALTTDELKQLNQQVDVQGQQARDVAQGWLEQEGLLEG